jgi:DNA-binding NarL/FixJ family response regulator/anti-sigma regulatory factor (Ser/Thr protein kinase)
MRQLAVEDAPDWTVKGGPPAKLRASDINETSLPDIAADENPLQAVCAAAITAERERMAREMNDSASKSLAGISMLAASLASTGWSGDARSIDFRLRELGRLARQAVTEANSVINDLGEDAVACQLRSAAMAFGLASGTAVTVEMPRATDTTEDIRREFGAILREALINVERHARATRVKVSLRAAGEQLQLAIEDNGAGFSMPATVGELRPAARGGLSRMRERARRLDGIVLIRTSPGHGTRIEVRIPVAERARPQLRAVLPPRKIRILIADRNPVLRFGLRAVLEQAPGLEVAAEVTAGADLAELIRRHSPDVVLLDARMTLPDGMVTLRQVSELTSIVMVTSADDDVLLQETAEVGARVCALHGAFDLRELIRIVHDAATAGPRRSPDSGPQADYRLVSYDQPDGSPRQSLRPREREIMELIAEGLSNRQIASRLVVSEKTVKNHICSIYSRLGVHGRTQAVRSWLVEY